MNFKNPIYKSEFLDLMELITSEVISFFITQNEAIYQTNNKDFERERYSYLHYYMIKDNFVEEENEES